MNVLLLIVLNFLMIAILERVLSFKQLYIIIVACTGLIVSNEILYFGNEAIKQSIQFEVVSASLIILTIIVILSTTFKVILREKGNVNSLEQKTYYSINSVYFIYYIYIYVRLIIIDNLDVDSHAINTQILYIIVYAILVICYRRYVLKTNVIR